MDNINWTAEFEALDTTQCWDLYVKKLTEILKKHMSYKKQKRRKKPKWITNSVKVKIAQKRQSWRKYKFSKAPEDLKSLQNHQKELKAEICKQKANVEKKLAAKYNIRSKIFLSLCK